ncbi:MAG: methyltransferase domain-containing protein [Pelolinea sp.]|nr:methyltransferase domain-containing protein [Pelolinea sp.]
MSANPEFWHQRYTQQVRWTLAARRYIFDKIGVRPSQRILEVGCGSGAVLESLIKDGFSNAIGLDIDYAALRLAISEIVTNADALKVPFARNSFDISLCHFLLLWVADPLKVLKEMARVTRPGGWVIALAEPDYGGRIDFPEELIQLGKAQSQSLQDQGADVFTGCKLKGLFTDCGLQNIQSGIISAEWHRDFDQAEFDLEWSVLRKDLEGKMSSEELERYYKIDLEASRQGRRVLFVPIFYAFGRVPE